MSLDRQCALYNEAPTTAMDLKDYKAYDISPFEANDGRKRVSLRIESG
jgi:hypothetical protein